jgi:3',5'-cyclic AMP phosphodiesterase CpdA
MHRFHDGEYSKRLSQHIIGEFAARHAHFTHDASRVHLLVSGDITYTAQPEEFRLAQDFLTEVCEGLGISTNRVYIVPGNHDVDWQLGRVNLSHRFDNYIQFLVEFYGEDLFRARHPKITWDLRINSKRPEPWDLLSIQHDPNASLMILGLNSCVYETHQDHYGLIGGRQLRVAEELLDGSSSAGIRVAMFHHHLHPFPEFIQTDENSQIGMDLSIIRDSGIVERQLERMKFDLILHGHKHKPQIRETVIRNVGNSTADNAKLIVCGAGSVGVNAVELEHNVSNQYQVVEVLRNPRKKAVDFLRIEWRTLEVSPEAEWVTPGSWIITG